MDQMINEHGEELERIGDIALNCHFWDCECQDDYIHPMTQTICGICGCEQEEMPPSRENEVADFRRLGILDSVGV